MYDLYLGSTDAKFMISAMFSKHQAPLVRFVPDHERKSETRKRSIRKMNQYRLFSQKVARIEPFAVLATRSEKVRSQARLPEVSYCVQFGLQQSNCSYEGNIAFAKLAVPNLMNRE